MGEKIELNVVALANSDMHPGNFAIILEESEGIRRLPIIIGAFEAQAIAVALENNSPGRPLTHDLFKNTLNALEASVEEIIITELRDGIFFANLLVNYNSKIWKVDSRTSDAIALAVRFGCPIYTFEAVLDEAGVVVEEQKEIKREKKASLVDYSLTELQDMLNQVIEKEDYESAAKIRDVIEKKKQGN